MLASVLNSQIAVEASVRVVRAFVLMREQLAAHKELARKTCGELERRVSGHDEAIQNLFEAIRQLVEPPLPEDRREIGFHVRETSPPYRDPSEPVREIISMPSTRDIRRRIKSVKNTAQITKAMQMVAAAKMRKAQQAALVGPAVCGVAERGAGRGRDAHGGLRTSADGNAPGRKARRHSGEHGPRFVRRLEQQSVPRGGEAGQEHHGVHHRRAQRRRNSSRARNGTLAAEFTYKDTPQFAEARAISKFAQDLFLKGEVDAVDILFTNFISTLVQQPKIVPFLPIGKIKAVTAGHGDAPAQELPRRRSRRTFLNLSRTRKPCWARCCRTA